MPARLARSTWTVLPTVDLPSEPQSTTPSASRHALPTGAEQTGHPLEFRTTPRRLWLRVTIAGFFGMRVRPLCPSTAEVEVTLATVSSSPCGRPVGDRRSGLLRDSQDARYRPDVAGRRIPAAVPLPRRHCLRTLGRAGDQSPNRRAAFRIYGYQAELGHLETADKSFGIALRRPTCSTTPGRPSTTRRAWDGLAGQRVRASLNRSTCSFARAVIDDPSMSSRKPCRATFPASWHDLQRRTPRQRVAHPPHAAGGATITQ